MEKIDAWSLPREAQDEMRRQAMRMRAELKLSWKEIARVVDFPLYLALNEIEHTKTKARHPQTNGICERFHKTVLQEFYQVTFRKKLYLSLDELQADLDAWLGYYNNERTHQGKICCGRTPMQTLFAAKEVWIEKVQNLN
jgi:transposase InsO family protein